MSRHAIKILLRETKKDPEFRDRWANVAPLTDDNKKVTVLIVDQFVEVTGSFIKEFPNLQFIVTPTTGKTHIKIDNPKVKVLSLEGERDFLKGVRSVSELVFYYILRFSRFHMDPPRSLNESTLGIIGTGRIGLHVKEIGKAFHMKVLCWDMWDRTGQKGLEKVFPQCDYISIHLAETAKTKGLVSKKLISLMKERAVLINTSRASIVNEDFAIDMIERGNLLGLCLDVTDRKDIVHGLNHNCEEHKLADKTKIIYTKHIGGTTLEDRIRTDNFMAQKLAMHLRERPYTKPTTSR